MGNKPKRQHGNTGAINCLRLGAAHTWDHRASPRTCMHSADGKWVGCKMHRLRAQTAGALERFRSAPIKVKVESRTAGVRDSHKARSALHTPTSSLYRIYTPTTNTSNPKYYTYRYIYCMASKYSITPPPPPRGGGCDHIFLLRPMSE